MNRNINLKYSVKRLSDEKIATYLNEIKSKIILNDNTRELICVKCCELNVLNGLKSIIEEICDCLVLGNNQAAITLTNHLFENTLKQVLITWDSEGRQIQQNLPIDETFKNEVEEYDKKDMEPNINRCRSKGLITKEEAKRLIDLKNLYRNSFSHASYSTLFDGATTTLYIGDLSGLTNIKKERVSISKVPFLSLSAQKTFADKQAKRYFIEVYEFIDNMDRKLLDLYPDIKELVLQQKRN